MKDMNELVNELVEDIEMPEDIPVAYEVWAIGFDEEDVPNGASMLLTTFSDPDKAVAYAKELTLAEVVNLAAEDDYDDLTYETHSISIEVETVVPSADEEELNILEELGIEESGVSRLIKAAYALLGLETFFTTGADESRAWTYTKGCKAPQAAGVIHTDFERGFIRAEVIKYDDYVALGSEKACREAGKIGVEGKEYVVQDGDIMHFLFNV